MGNVDTATTDNSPGGGDLANLAGAIRQIGAHVESLRERTRLLEAVIENFPGGISLFDANLQMVLCNEQQKILLDYPEELFADGFPTLEGLFRFNALRGEYGPGDIDEQVARRVRLVRERKAHVYERTRPNGTIVEIRGMPIDGGGFVTTYLDVTDQRRNQALIAHMAHHDQLTDLPNRALFTDRLQTAIALAKRSGLVALHCLNIDKFKPINDTLGHDAGDALLVATAERLGNAVRENDTVARLSGDEFAIVQTGIREPADASVLARRVLSLFSSPFEIAGTTLHVNLSNGVALAPTDGVTTDDVLRKADTALNRSKTKGGARFSFYSDPASDPAA